MYLSITAQKRVVPACATVLNFGRCEGFVVDPIDPADKTRGNFIPKLSVRCGDLIPPRICASGLALTV